MGLGVPKPSSRGLVMTKISSQKGGGLPAFFEAIDRYNDLELQAKNATGLKKTKRREPSVDKHRSNRRVAYARLHWPGDTNIMH